MIWFDTDECTPKLLENFAFDKYELEPSPLTQRILERRMPGNCWQVSELETSLYIPALLSSEKTNTLHVFCSGVF